MSTYQHILVPTDFSKYSEAAAERAVELAGLYGARVSLLHVVDYVPPRYVTVTLPEEYASESKLVERAGKYLAEWAQRVGLGDADKKVGVGSPKDQIIQAAKNLNADLIVVGSHGERGLGALIGSTTNAVLHQAPCDILSVQL